MIGYYVHHHGRGHLSRALTLAGALDDEVTGLSSLARPDGWPGEWVQLDRDDRAAEVVDPTARGHLHWVPVRDRGLSSRMARIAAWLQDARPELVVSDVSVEVTLLCRLLGVPVASVVQPGDRGDEVHRLGHGVSDLLVAFVPPEARPAVRGMTEEDHRRLLCLGSVSAHAASAAEGTTTSGAEARPTSAVPRSVVVLCGRGGGGLDGDALARARDLTPEWEWTVLGARAETWVPDPLPLLRRADVVVTHAGLGALADVALSRRPAVVLPQARPHDEQVSTAQVLAEDEWPAVVERDPATADWAGLLARAAAQDGAAWSRWHDGESAVRFAKVVREWVAASRSDR